MNAGRITVITGILCVLGGASLSASAQSVPAGAAEAGTEPERWSSFLPLMAEEATSRGYELPLPFGVSAIYNFIERDIQVDDLRLGLDGGAPQSVSRFIDLGSDSRVNVALGRIDVWLLPFVNVYGLFGYVNNESTTRGTVTLPDPGPPPGTRTTTFVAQTELDGFVGGGGLTLAGGYRSFFVMVDANYTQTDMGFDDRFRAVVASARAGWNGKAGNVPLRFWIGGMYWDTRNTARSTVITSDGSTLNFEADQGPKNPWNASVGTSVAFSRHWECFAEYGFNFDDVQVLATGLTFRF